MNRLRTLGMISSVLLAAGMGAGSSVATEAGKVSLSVGQSFQQQLDLDDFRVAAVQEDGRVKTFESLAREKLKYVSPGGLEDVDPVAWYLDMILTPEHYQAAKIIRIKSKALRARIVQGVRSLVPAAERTGVIAPAELDAVASSGRVSPRFLDHPTVQTVLTQLERDLRGTGKAVQQVRSARALTRPGVLASLMLVIPPPGGGEKDPWIPLQAVAGGRAAPRDEVHAGMGMGDASGLPADLAAGLGGDWQKLSRGWRFQDVAAVNAALEGLSTQLAQVNPQLYPERSRLEWELWYYRNKKLTGGWLIYFFAIPLLLMGFIYGFRWARWAGLGLFCLAFAVHTFSIGLRWWLAGRIPNANMFEAIIASAWFGGVVALVLEWALRRQRLRLLPALSASAYAMVAMMFGRFMTVKLNSDITTVMPVLDRTIWLYIHTNIVIASYALIFFASVTATLYLVFRGMHSWAPRVLGGDWGRYAYAQGGASSVILGREAQPMNQGLARTLDGATMIFLEVAFLSLWVGTILGAVWADVSWGRPWGWDPKEVFAFNTWLVFLVLVHVRLKVRDKALWTAVLALIGCAVMIFNWVAVNFVIVGLHSYA